MTADAPALTVEDMSGIFKALRAEDPSYTLEHALGETLALARTKGLNAEQFSATLQSAGIEITAPFQQWLDQKFAGGN